MFRSFASFVDPFQSYAATPPRADVWPFLVEHLRPFRFVMAASLVFAAIGASIEVWLIGYAGRLIDLLSVTPPQQLWAVAGSELLVVAAIILIGRPLNNFIRESLDDVALRPNAETLIGWRMHRHVLRQSVGWFQSDLAGRIAGQVRQGATAAIGAVYQVQHTLTFITVYVIGSIWLLGSIDLRLVVPLIVWIGLYLSLMAFILPRYEAASARYQAAQSALSGMLVDSYSNIDTLKLFADESALDRDGRERFGEAREAFVGMQRAEVIMNVGLMILGSVMMVGLVGFAVVLWTMDAAPLGLIASALALSFQISSMAEWLLDAVSSLFGHIGTLRESLKVAAQPLEIADAPDAVPFVPRGGEIVLSGVTHHYGRGGGGLDDIKLRIVAGQKVGLIGRSGAGKSTLVNLLLRFHRLEGGSIQIDGQDIESVTQDSLRRQIAMVPQSASLLHRSVRDNIAYGWAGSSDAEIAAAARSAEADGFIEKLRDRSGRTGYDAMVGERGVSLSGGQRQRIALARAFLKNAPILILDEATSALDSEVEAAIQSALARIMEGKTVIAIAHRLSTIARMDRIVVLEDGRVAEDGTHDELIGRGGIYAGLWARQSGGFIGDDF